MAKQSLDKLYEKYAEDLYRYLLFLSHDHNIVEDLVQESFYRAYLHMEELHEEKVKPWLFRVAHNAFIDQKRKERKQTLKENDFFDGKSDSLFVEERLVMRERLHTTFQHIALLPDRQKHAILLVGVNQFSQKEAARIIGVTDAHFRILLFRARQTLRQKERMEPNE